MQCLTRHRNVTQLTTSLVNGWRSFQTLPLIDVSPLIDNNASVADIQHVGKQLDNACREAGFFIIKGHGISDTISSTVLSTARQWFETLPLETKQQIALSPASHYRGYQALGANVTRYDGGGFVRDWHEGIDLYKEIPDGDAHPSSPIHGTNPWPSQLPEFEASLRAYIESCLTLGEQLMRGIAVGLDLSPDTFQGKRAGNSYWVTRVIYYPPLQQSTKTTEALNNGSAVDRSEQLSCGEHTDYGLLTIVNQENDVAALQVKNAEGQWITADPIPGTFVCNIGDMLQSWTNGRYTPTLHRVVNASGDKSRVSIPFFYEPNFDAVVEPLEELLQGSEKPLYKPVMYGRHLESKVLRNFDFKFGVVH